MPVGLVMSFCLIHASMKTVLWILFYRISPFDVIRIWGNPSEVTTCYLGNRGPYMEFLLSLIKELKNGLKIKENLIAIKKKPGQQVFSLSSYREEEYIEKKQRKTWHLS